MYIDTTFPPDGSGRLAQFMRMVDAFERDEIETAVDLLIAQLDAVDGDADGEDDDRAGVLMIAPAVDYDPALDLFERDGCAGDPVDAEEDDPAATDIDRGEGAAWTENDDDQSPTMRVGRSVDHEDDEDDDGSDTCAAGDDGCAPVMTYHGIRWGSHEYEVDREPDLCGAFLSAAPAFYSGGSSL